MNEEIHEYHYCKSFFQFTRRISREVFIGNIPLGGTNPIRIQSMTNTDTMDVAATVRQSIKMIESGCEYVRITTPNMKSVASLAAIKKELHLAGFDTPIIADVHFNTAVALEAARVAEKVRINPGNYTDRNMGKFHFSDDEYNIAIDRIRENMEPLINVCKQYGTALRIGSNQGSLSERIVSRYGDTPEGMVEAAMEFVRICNEMDFHKIVLSMKSSNTRTMIFATRLLVHKMMEEGFDYPLHLGVTEAGAGEDGRIKSAVGIGTLLTDGIGDTIRVSLTELPEEELAPAKKLVSRFNLLSSPTQVEPAEPFKNPFIYSRIPADAFANIGEPNPPVVVSTMANPEADYRLDDKNITEHTALISGHSDQLIHEARKTLYQLLNRQNNKPKIFRRIYSGSDKEAIQLRAGTDFGALLIDGFCDGICIETPDISDTNFPIDLCFSILQAARSRFSSAEFISCPSCGRTQFDIISVAKNVREKTRHLKGITIAVMGCIVNGPGEMAGADYGYVGSGKRVVTLFKKEIPVMKNIPEEQAIEMLLQLIRDNGDWKE